MFFLIELIDLDALDALYRFLLNKINNLLASHF